MKFTLLLVLLACHGLCNAAPVHPNMVIFLADDYSVDDCSAYGCNDIPAPNMESLAKEGWTFDRAYVVSPSCAPSRAALLTGLYGLRSGAIFNHQQVKPNTKKWPAYFQSLGYEVVAIGKVSHYRDVTTYGFDHAAFFKYHEDICVEKALEWLAVRNSEKPLCLFVGTNWPHVPWPAKGEIDAEKLTIPAELAKTPETKLARARYATAVMNTDRDLGLVRAATKRHLPEDTVFVFTADHGSQFPFSKWNLYEKGLRTPLMVAWPGKLKANKRTSAMVNWLDLLPTLLDIAGAEPAKIAPDLDGHSFLPVLQGKTNEHRDRIFGTHSGDGRMNFYPSRSVRMGDWKYIRNLDPKLEFHTHVDLASQDTGYWPSWIAAAKTDKGIAAIVHRYHHRPAEELYNLANDASELTNLAEAPEHKTQLTNLRKALDEWMREHQDEGLATDAARRPPIKPIPAK